MEHRERRASIAEIARVAAATERWSEAGTARARLWSELTDQDKERLAIRRIRSTAAAFGWDAVLHRLGMRRAKE